VRLWFFRLRALHLCVVRAAYALHDPTANRKSIEQPRIKFHAALYQARLALRQKGTKSTRSKGADIVVYDLISDRLSIILGDLKDVAV
jgi:hypothetical protein